MLQLSHTNNKVSIRREWDKPIIANFSSKLGRKLSYFGLPGPDIEDLNDWGAYLGWKTGIEFYSNSSNGNEDQRRKINQLQTNVMLGGFNNEWELRKGSIEDIILNGYDVDGNPPALLQIERGQLPRMIYELHNWDFQGGLGYRTKKREDVKRIEAIKKCIGLQKGHPFLYLMTLNVRHTLGEELMDYLKNQGKEIHSDKYKEILDWYSGQGAKKKTEHIRLKAVVPLFIRRIAEIYSFDCFCYPPIYYQGWKEHMIHFVFILIPKKTALPCFSEQKLTDVIDLPILCAEEGVFKFNVIQHPHHSNEDSNSLMKSLSLPVKVD
jgi:hypothetical protein